MLSSPTIPVEIRTCRTCGAKILLKDVERARNGTRKPLDLDGSPHVCQWTPPHDKENLCLTAIQFVSEVNRRLGGNPVLRLVREEMS